ncbi:hypothetical protein V5799_005790 [Amblyomma americanum]|uniref:Uncharacterized protein n=1 Tax=Amblyomma americanum TaxID=6943 RepID=A0AAQ4DY88_AMBAM
MNKKNVDGLKALHQACIDDNIAMAGFLVDVATYLIEHAADVSRVNNDGDLPIDIAESEEMEELLQAEVDRVNGDCEATSNDEEALMLEDAKQMLKNNRVPDKVHPKTGATSLHVAAAKGYVKIMSVLIQTGVDLNSQDVDG